MSLETYTALDKTCLSKFTNFLTCINMLFMANYGKYFGVKHCSCQLPVTGSQPSSVTSGCEIILLCINHTTLLAHNLTCDHSNLDLETSRAVLNLCDSSGHITGVGSCSINRDLMWNLLVLFHPLRTFNARKEYDKGKSVKHWHLTKWIRSHLATSQLSPMHSAN